MISKYTRWFMFILIILSLLYLPSLERRIATAQNTIESAMVTIRKASITKFDWTTGDLDYKGTNKNGDAADSDTDWIIYKYIWDGGNPTIIQERTGSWTGRAGLFP